MLRLPQSTNSVMFEPKIPGSEPIFTESEYKSWLDNLGINDYKIPTGISVVTVLVPFGQIRIKPDLSQDDINSRRQLREKINQTVESWCVECLSKQNNSYTMIKSQFCNDIYEVNDCLNTMISLLNRVNES